MKPLLARHALSQTALRVSDEMRPPRDLRDAGADPVYAVFSSQEDEEFLGLVAPRRFGISRERIFADLLARPAIEPAHPETPLTELLLRMESDGVDAVPVVDETGSYHGVVTLSTLLRTHLEREQQLLAKAQRLRTQADRERRRVQRWAARVDDLNRAFGKLLSLTGQMRSEQELLQGGIECLAEILDARFCAFLIVDGSGERTRFLHTGFTAEEVERVGTPPEGKGLLGVVLREGSSLRLTDRTRDPRSHGLPPGHPEMKTLLAVPVANKGQILGNLYMSEKKNGEAFTAEDEILAQGFANVLALAVASAMGQAERRRAEEQLAEAQKLESVGRLAAGVAHEINTPSQYVSDNLRFLEESFGDLEEALKAFSELIAAAESGSIGPELLDRVKEKANEVDLEYLVEEAPKAIQQSLEGIGRVTTIVRAMKSFAH
ncbi:MAG: GAF domain-containing protein, partial [Myxococcota bacterium]